VGAQLTSLNLRSLLIGVSGLALIAGSASAQTSEVGIEEVVVTAQNRSQTLQEVPLAISAVTGEKLAAEHIATFADIAKVAPGFVAAPNYGYIRYSSMRGISNNQYGFADDPSIALFVDGVYQGRGGTGMQTNSAFDIDRIEVIKGPQATLFGRSSIAGAISIITRQPTFDGFAADAMVGVGNYNRITARGAVNLPLSENLALRLAVNSENRDQVYKDLNGRGGLGGVNVKAARATLAYRGDALRLTLKGTVERRRDNAFPVQTVDQPKFRVTHSFGGRDAPADFDIYEGMAKVEYDFNDALSATLTSSVRQVDNYFVLDYDARPEIVGGPYTQGTKDRLIGQDLIFVFEQGPVSASFGGSWFSEDLSGYVHNWVNSTLAFTGAYPTGLAPNDYSAAFFELGNYDGKFHGYSVFADATYEITPALRVTGGVRFNSDTKRYTHDIPNPAVLPQNAGKAFAGAYYNWGYWTSRPVTSKDTWEDVSFRASVSYDLSDAVTTYLSFNQGWKAGGIDSFKTVTPAPFQYYFGRDVAAAGGVPNVYDPENSNSYEFGLKGRFMQGRLSTNLALYQYTYEDLQVNVTRGVSVTVENVGRARGRGGELEIRAIPFEGLELFSNTAYNDTKIKSFPDNLSQVGMPLNRAPMWSGSAGATVTLPVGAPGDLKLQGDISYRSKLRADNALVYLVPGYTLANARLSYTTADGKYGVTAYVENMFNKMTWNSAAIRRAFAATPLNSRSVFGDPRFIGVDFTVRY
jgi:iron complex outermembrane receptor protein